MTEDEIAVQKQQVKHRLIGTVVLVALAIIFLPDILDGKKEQVEDVFVEIPLRKPLIDDGESLPPAINSEVIHGELTHSDVMNDELGDEKSGDDLTPAKTEQWVVEQAEIATDNSAEVGSSAPAAAPSTASTSVSSVSQPSSSKPVQTIDVGWTLQLGSFRDANNVIALIKQLRLEGFNAYTLPEVPISGQLTRVYVGPALAKSELEQMLPALEKLTQLKGRVIPFQPQEN